MGDPAPHLQLPGRILLVRPGVAPGQAGHHPVLRVAGQAHHRLVPSGDGVGIGRPQVDAPARGQAQGCLRALGLGPANVAGLNNVEGHGQVQDHVLDLTAEVGRLQGDDRQLPAQAHVPVHRVLRIKVRVASQAVHVHIQLVEGGVAVAAPEVAGHGDGGQKPVSGPAQGAQHQPNLRDHGRALARGSRQPHGRDQGEVSAQHVDAAGRPEACAEAVCLSPLDDPLHPGEPVEDQLLLQLHPGVEPAGLSQRQGQARAEPHIKPLGVRLPVPGARLAEVGLAVAVGEGHVQLAARGQQVVAGGLEGSQVAHVPLARAGAGAVQDAGRAPFAQGQVVDDSNPPGIRGQHIPLEQQLAPAPVVVLTHMVGAVQVVRVGEVAVPLAVGAAGQVAQLAPGRAGVGGAGRDLVVRAVAHRGPGPVPGAHARGGEGEHPPHGCVAEARGPAPPPNLHLLQVGGIEQGEVHPSRSRGRAQADTVEQHHGLLAVSAAQGHGLTPSRAAPLDPQPRHPLHQGGQLGAGRRLLDPEHSGEPGRVISRALLLHGPSMHHGFIFGRILLLAGGNGREDEAGGQRRQGRNPAPGGSHGAVRPGYFLVMMAISILELPLR